MQCKARFIEVSCASVSASALAYTALDGCTVAGLVHGTYGAKLWLIGHGDDDLDQQAHWRAKPG